MPIVFDSRMNEYHLTHVGRGKKGYSLIYHCPWCGGRAPYSKRATFFAVITSSEMTRLQKLTAGLKSLDDAKRRFGRPSRDRAQGMGIITPGSARKPSQAISYRTLTFTRLSKTADVLVVDYGPKGIGVTFQGKYLSKKTCAA